MDFKNIIYTLITSVIMIPTLYSMIKIAIKNECDKYITETIEINKLYYMAFIPPLVYVIYACLNYGVNMYAVVNFVVAIALGWSCITDFKHQELADTSTLIFFVIAFGMWLGYDQTTQLQQILTIVVVIGILTIICKKFACLGFGDIKLLIPILLFLNPTQYLAFLSNSLIIAFIYAIGLITLKKVSEERRFAFGPFLIYGFYLTLFKFDVILFLFNLLSKLL